MALTPKIEIKQSQSLLMTPQLRQAINLLQMSNLELGELVSKELETNPFLEREDERLTDSLPHEQTIDDYDAPQEAPNPQDETPDIDYDNSFDDDFGSDREGYEVGQGADWRDYLPPGKTGTDDDFNYFEQRLPAEKSLYRYLNEQILLTFATARERIIAARLTEFLDAAGYFRGDCTAIAKQLQIKESEVKKILSRLQTFEPSGIFAVSLAECLAIQLKDRGRFDPYMEFLLDHLDLVAERKFKELKKLGNLTDEDLSSMLADIRALNPKPAAGFANDLTGYVIPDVFVKTNKYGEYLIELNARSLPRVLINREYYSEIKNLSSQNKEAKRYLKDRLSSAGFLVRALHQRAATILRVAEEIVRHQRDFFEKGIEFIKPLLLRDVADALEMHESTVSRVTSGKYMHTPRGIFELKYFFSSAAGTYTGDENTSVTAIKHRIKQLTDEEKPDNILSDDMIVECLARQGIKIARRTVAKYREGMGIPTSGQRKRLKRSAF